MERSITTSSADFYLTDEGTDVRIQSVGENTWSSLDVNICPEQAYKLARALFEIADEVEHGIEEYRKEQV